MQWFATDWLNDPQVSLCEPATRGILMDWLCNMHLLDRSGQITGKLEQLARLGRCTAVQVEAALQDLIQTKAADVTFRNDVVTVVNRRMKREEIARKNGALRVARFRSNAPCNGKVTPYSHKSEVIGQKGEVKLSPAEVVVRDKELKRVEEAMASIRNSYDSHQSWGEHDRTQFKKLKSRRDELKTMLGIKL